MFGIRVRSVTNSRILRSFLPMKLLYSTRSPQPALQSLGIDLQKNLVQRNTNFYSHDLEMVRCMKFDKNGEIESLGAIDLRGGDLFQQHGLLPRDLRKIEKSRRYDLVPILLVRKNCIMLSLLNIRALIKSDMVLLFDPMGVSLDSKTHTNFVNDLRTRLRNQDVRGRNKDPLPFEFRALESVFIYAVSNLTAELQVHTTVTKGILKDLENSITTDKLKYLLVQNKKLSAFHKKTLLMREMIDELLDQDEDLFAMNLTARNNGHLTDITDHDEIEMLLETYYIQVNEIVQSVAAIISNVRTTSEIINIILDSNRNQLMLLGLRFSIGLLSMGGCLFVASLYGMNLENYIEETHYGFGTITTIGLVAMGCLFMYSIRRLTKLQKITLSSSR